MSRAASLICGLRQEWERLTALMMQQRSRRRRPSWARRANGEHRASASETRGDWNEGKRRCACWSPLAVSDDRLLRDHLFSCTPCCRPPAHSRGLVERTSDRSHRAASSVGASDLARSLCPLSALPVGCPGRRKPRRSRRRAASRALTCRRAIDPSRACYPSGCHGLLNDLSYCSPGPCHREKSWTRRRRRSGDVLTRNERGKASGPCCGG